MSSRIDELLNPQPRKSLAKTRDEAFSASFEAHGGAIFGFFRARVRDEHLAEDLTQSFWVWVFEKFEPQKMGQLGLLFFKARQILIDEMRKLDVRSFVELADELPEPEFGVAEYAPRTQEPATDAEEQALYAKFWEMFPGVELHESHKEAFWLKERYGFTYEELTKRFGKPRSTIADWVKSVKTACAAYLNEEGIE